MKFREPFAAYNAGSNLEAHLVCGLLVDAEIEAVVVEDVSQAGTWMGGSIAEIHKPQVWIERADIERARPVLTDYEQRSAARRAARSATTASGEPILVTCEECGQRTEFPGSQKGSVQSCPLCRAYLDVGDEVGVEGWEDVPEEEHARARPETEDSTPPVAVEGESLAVEADAPSARSQKLGTASVACGLAGLLNALFGSRFMGLDQMSALAACGLVTVLLAIAAVVLALGAFRARKRDRGVAVIYPTAGLLLGAASLFCGSGLLATGTGYLAPTGGTPETWRSEQYGFQVTVPSELWVLKPNPNVLAEFTCPRPTLSAVVADALPAGTEAEYQAALAYGLKVKRETPTLNGVEQSNPNAHGRPHWLYMGDAKTRDEPYFFGISITRVGTKAVLLMFEGPYRLTTESGRAQEARSLRTQAKLFLESVK